MMKLLLPRPEIARQPLAANKQKPSCISCYRSTMLYFVWSIVFFLTIPCYAQPLSSEELIINAKQHDNQSVNYRGEVIGDIMVRGNYAWINVNDSQNAIGIWTPVQLIKDIQYTGGYSSAGDWVVITGIFHRACRQHGGDMDIHAATIVIDTKGSRLEEKPSSFKIKVAISLLIICLTATIIYFITLSYRKRR